MKTLLGMIDTLNHWAAKAVSWMVLALVLIMCLEVLMRHVFNAPLLWAYEVPIMLGATIYAMGWGFVHQRDGHTRIDVLYGRLSARGRAITDVIGHLLVLFPLLGVLISAAMEMAIRSWSIHERMALSHWYPPAAPLRTMMVVALCLLALQSVAQLVRASQRVLRREDS